MRTFIIADNQYITSIGIATFIKAELGATTILNAISMKDLQLKIRLYPNAIVIVDYTVHPAYIPDLSRCYRRLS